MSERPHCRAPSNCAGRTPGKHCPPCTLAAKWKEPEFREKRAEAYRSRMRSDPEFKAAHVAACQGRMHVWRQAPENAATLRTSGNANLALANTPEALAKRKAAIRAKAYAGIPERLHDDVRRLARRVSAAEAKRMVMEDEQQRARRAVAQAEADMRAKHERDLRNRY